jgi:hypothetical protein
MGGLGLRHAPGLDGNPGQVSFFLEVRMLESGCFADFLLGMVPLKAR